MSRFNPRGNAALWLCCVSITAAVTFGIAADSAPDAVFSKVMAATLADVAETTGIACMASVERTRYLPRTARNSPCAGLIATTASAPRGAVEWHDRLRLDVTAAKTGEQFTLTGASPFEQTDIANILHDAALRSGEFSAFLQAVIAGDPSAYRPATLQQTPGGKLVAIGFDVPASKSHLTIGAYRGALYALPESDDVRRLTLEAAGFGSVCRAQYAIDYAATRVGERQVILPQSSVLESIGTDGSELRTETYYSSCRRIAGEHAVTVSAATSRPLPPNTKLRVRFQPAINGETAAAGDPVVGVIRTTVKDKLDGVIVHAGDRLHGRIALIEQVSAPTKHWNVAVVFQTIERGVGDHGIDQGVEQPVSLVPLNDGSPEQQKLRPPNGAYFVFQQANLVLDRFETDWETR